MGKYQNVNCPICEKPLENGEVIVVCPDCGAPYHRKCVMQKGACIYTELHEAGKSWEMPKVEQKYDGDAPKRCSRCGTINPLNGLFCEVCGTPLNQPEQKQDATQTQEANTRPNMGMNQNVPPMGGKPMRPPHQMAYDPFTTPFGGVNPDEDIDEIPVKDWAIFIGQNTQYFIPKFKAMSEAKGGSFFNFSAAIFQGFYFLYRKMYLWGILLLLAFLVLSIPSTLIQVDYMRQMVFEQEAWFNGTALNTLSTFCWIAQMGLRIACGFYSNRLYKMHCAKKISKLRTEYTEHTTYVEQLTKKGSASRTVLFIFVGGGLLLSMLSSMMMVSGYFLK